MKWKDIAGRKRLEKIAASCWHYGTRHGLLKLGERKQTKQFKWLLLPPSLSSSKKSFFSRCKQFFFSPPILLRAAPPNHLRWQQLEPLIQFCSFGMYSPSILAMPKCTPSLRVGFLPCCMASTPHPTLIPLSTIYMKQNRVPPVYNGGY
jgi:hypothetical protein